MRRTSKRSIAAGLICGASVIGLCMLFGRDHAAQAQFRIPKIPTNIPGIPGLPSGGSQRSGDLQGLKEVGNKWGELTDLDNPKRQDEIGQSIAVAIANRYPVSKNRELNQYVNLVGLTVACVSPRPQLNYAFGVLETNEVGAYSTPGGYVFVTRGALALMDDESELAGVLAHEVAHVAKNHGIEAVKSAKFKEVASTVVQNFGQQYAAFSAQIDVGLKFALETGYSQGQERDADSEAIKYLVASKYDPRGFVRFLNRLDDQSHRSRNPLMSTHPLTKDRIGAVTRQIASYRSTSNTTLRERFEANVKVR